MGGSDDELDELSDALLKRYMKRAKESARKLRPVFTKSDPDTNKYHNRSSGIERARVKLRAYSFKKKFPGSKLSSGQYPGRTHRYRRGLRVGGGSEPRRTWENTELDELSKELLQRYKRKAKLDFLKRDRGLTSGHTWSTKKQYADQARKTHNRDLGLSRASFKIASHKRGKYLAKTGLKEQSLDELSRARVSDYYRAAQADLRGVKPGSKKSKRRVSGLNNAIDRLRGTKWDRSRKYRGEEVESD